MINKTIFSHFKDFDRSLSCFRETVADANSIVRDSVTRYIAMIDTLDAAFALFYGSMTAAERAAMDAAFAKLANTVRVFSEASESNVTELKTGSPR